MKNRGSARMCIRLYLTTHSYMMIYLHPNEQNATQAQLKSLKTFEKYMMTMITFQPKKHAVW
jgi:hypothetical protein